MKHVLSASQFSREEISSLFATADRLKQERHDHGVLDYLRGKLVYLLFYEPSTRTRTSFGLAARYLGGRTDFTEAAGIFSSAAKGETLEDTIRADGIPFSVTDDLAATLTACDVFYQTRVQRERFADATLGEAAFLEVQTRFALNAANVATMRPNAIVLHPLPRVGEISPEVDADPRAKYFHEQTRNGLYIRMALLLMILRPDAIYT